MINSKALITPVNSIILFVVNCEEPLISFLLGSLFGPAAYYSGIILDIAISSNLYLAFIIMIIFWGSLMTLYSLNFKKFD